MQRTSMNLNMYTELYLVRKAVEDLKTSIVLSSGGRQIVNDIINQPWCALAHLHQLAHPRNANNSNLQYLIKKKLPSGYMWMKQRVDRGRFF